MGKIEEIFEDETTFEKKESVGNASEPSIKEKVIRRFFRNPDDRILGGVCGGLAAYLGWDPTPIRLLLFLLMFLYGVTIPIYCILWLIVPMARTATEKLQMRGESITVENIGKTVTDGFEKVSNSVNDYISSGKPRTALQKIADALVDILGVVLKGAVILLGIILFPPLLIVLFILIVVIGALIVGALGGGFGILYSILPSANWEMINSYPEWMLILASISTVLLIGIPVLSLIYSICSQIFRFKPVPNGIKMTLLVLWLICIIANIFFAMKYGIPFWGDWNNWWDGSPAGFWRAASGKILSAT
jgi:phage shock protein PspC (stress-responsive transcriptional regulator)